MAGQIPKRVLEDIRFRCDIVDVIGSYFALKRAGGSFKALCPFHKEKSPSFTVNPQRQSFHCFGCGAGGDVFGFIQKHEGVDFMTAVRMLAQRAGVPLEIEEERDEQGGVSKDVIYRIHEEVTEFYRRCLKQTPEAEAARRYLEKRQLPADIIDAFLVGYAPDRWDGIARWGAKHHYTPEQLEAAGLLVHSSDEERGDRVYDRFRGRVMFPIRDSQGRVIGFSGRTLEASPKAAKYVNSPETAVFKKSRILYALDRARRAIVDAREAIICEGQIDVIRCHQAGITTAVAAQGTAFTADHASVLRRFADSVVIVFDCDSAGQEAAVKAAGTFMEAGLSVRIASLPDDDDPDSLILKAGADRFREIVAQAESVVDFQVRLMTVANDLRSDAGIRRVTDAVLATIMRSPDPILRTRLVEQAAARLRLPLAVQDRMKQLMRRAAVRAPAESGDGQAQEQGEAPAAAPVRPADEVALCEQLAQEEEDAAGIAALVRDNLPPKVITDAVCRTFIRAAIAAIEAGSPIEEHIRAEARPDGELAGFAARVFATPSRLKGIAASQGTFRGSEVSAREAVQDFILSIWRRRLDTERRELGDEEFERRTQITLDLKSLRTWETGHAVIALEKGTYEESP